MKPRLLVSCLAASLLVSLAGAVHAQWTWLYPTLQGHNLYDVEFLTDSIAIAVGEAATVMVTSDGGTTWSVSPKTNGLTTTLRNVAAIDATTAVAVGDDGVVLRTVDAGLTWTHPSSGTTNDFARVDFLGAFGVIAGDGLWRSIDGGESWTLVLSGYTVTDIDVVSGTLAFAASAYPEVLLKSTDGGQTWSNIGLPYLHDPRVAFADVQTGVVSSAFGGYGGGTYYFTTDGGQTWVERYGPSTGSHDAQSAEEIIMVNAQTVYFAGAGGGCDPTFNCFSYGALARTLDGAATWEGVSASRPLFGLDLNSSGTVLAVGEAGNLWRWIPPAGWEQIGGAEYDGVFPSAMSFADPSTGIVSALNFISGGGPTKTVTLRTSNAGASWVGREFHGVVLNDLCHTRGSNPAAYAVGRIQINGVFHTGIFKSTDNGATWPLLWSQAPFFQMSAIEFADATHGVAVGSNGRALVLDNDVVTQVSVPGGGSLFGVAFADPAVAVAIGSSGLFRTADGGTTWSNVPAPAGAREEIAFASSTVGIAVGANGSILRTTDAGLTWLQVPAPTGSSLYKVAFANSTYGMIVGNVGAFLETTDAGESWTTIPAPTSSGFVDLMCFGPRHAYLASSNLGVFEYREDAVPTFFSSFHVRSRDFAAELRWSVGDDSDLQEFRVLRDGRLLATLERGSRLYKDEAVRAGTGYQYVLVAVDRDGSYTQSMPVSVTIPTSRVELLPNQPNPFNPVTTIRFVVPEKMTVQLTVHDVTGRVVATLVDGVRNAGMNTIRWNADGMASGVYFAKLRAGKSEVSQKVVLLK